MERGWLWVGGKLSKYKNMRKMPRGSVETFKRYAKYFLGSSKLVVFTWLKDSMIAISINLFTLNISREFNSLTISIMSMTNKTRKPRFLLLSFCSHRSIFRYRRKMPLPYLHLSSQQTFLLYSHIEHIFYLPWKITCLFFLF